MQFENPVNKVVSPLQCENIVNYKRGLNIINIELKCSPLLMNTEQ
jgi:hypothetical protein